MLLTLKYFGNTSNCKLLAEFFQTKLSHPHGNKLYFPPEFFGSSVPRFPCQFSTLITRDQRVDCKKSVKWRFWEKLNFEHNLWNVGPNKFTTHTNTHKAHKRTSREGKGSPTFPFLCYSNHSCQTLEGRSSCRSCFCFKRRSKGGIVQLYGNGEAERASMGWPTQSLHVGTNVN